MNLVEDPTYEASYQKIPEHPSHRAVEWPGTYPTQSTFAMSVNIQYDMFPEEITWQMVYENVDVTTGGCIEECGLNLLGGK